MGAIQSYRQTWRPRMETLPREVILASAGPSIYGIDLEGRLTFINEAGMSALGYSAEQLGGRTVHTALRHSHADGTPYSRSTSPILNAMRRRKTVSMSNEKFWRPDGSSLLVDYTASPLIENGAVAGMVVTFQDVSERRRVDSMKDEFISTVSHELRTPLTSLRASLGLLSTGVLVDRPEKQGRMVQMALGNCERLVRLVNDILDFDSIDKGESELRRAPLQATDLLRRTADSAGPAASQANITISVIKANAKAVADEDRVLQVLNELVANAIKFSPPHTTIHLRARAASEALVCFCVEDQGHGIAPEKLGRIFDRFQQGDSSDSRALGGTGLGLALCRSIIEQHGGRIWAESMPEGGSRFSFTLLKARRAGD